MEAVLLDGQRSLEAADEAMARFDVDAVVAHLSAAVRAFTASGEVRQAAMACVRLGDALVNGMGNLTAGRAWFTRAVRLVADEEPCLEQGWAAVAAMGCDVGDPDVLLAAAELALDRARRFGDLDLETKALADGGLAHVQAGRIDEGFALLDEAMALACGPAAGETGAKSACSFFTACYYTAAFDRAGSWTGLLRQRGLMGPAPGHQAFLSNHCASLQGALLVELGRWGEAEAVLREANEQFLAATGIPGFHTCIVLADLRIRQGRLTDAETLLMGKEQALEAMLPSARLHLARGDHDLARAAAERGLRALGAVDRHRAVSMLEVLVHAALAVGDLAAATEAIDDLTARASASHVPAMAAQLALTTAAVRTAAGDVAGAIAAIEDGLGEVDAQRAPWRRVLLHIELIRLRERAGDGAIAAAESRVAESLLDQLDVVLDPADSSVLAPAEDPPAGAGEIAVLERSGTGWTVACSGRAVQLRDSKGMRYLAVLVAEPGQERHALDLVDRIEGIDPDGLDRRRLGDAGPGLDPRARAAYRRRIEELRAEIDESLEAGRLEDAEASQDEHDQLVQQLAKAFGLGGRARHTGSAAERARLNVTRSIRTAINRVAEVLPEPGAALDRHVRTGLYCRYEPSEGDLRWIVQSGLNGIAPT